MNTAQNKTENTKVTKQFQRPGALAQKLPVFLVIYMTCMSLFVTKNHHFLSLLNITLITFKKYIFVLKKKFSFWSA